MSGRTASEGADSSAAMPEKTAANPYDERSPLRCPACRADRWHASALSPRGLTLRCLGCGWQDTARNIARRIRSGEWWW